MLAHCMIKWWQLRDSLEDFSQQEQGIRQGRRTRALLCTFMLWVPELIEKVSFSGWKISLISRFEWIISLSAYACCTRKLLRLLSKKTLHSGIELTCEFPEQCLIITKTHFWIAPYCFCLFGEFAKVSERQVWCVRVAHLHSAVCALSSPNQSFPISFPEPTCLSVTRCWPKGTWTLGMRLCFQSSTNLDKHLFHCLLCWC